MLVYFPTLYSFRDNQYIQEYKRKEIMHKIKSKTADLKIHVTLYFSFSVILAMRLDENQFLTEPCHAVSFSFCTYWLRQTNSVTLMTAVCCALIHYFVLVMGDISNFEFDTISIFFNKNIDISILFDISKSISILPLKYRYIESGRYFNWLH